MGRVRFYIASAVLCSLVVVGQCNMTADPPATVTVPTKPTPTTTSTTTPASHTTTSTTLAPNTTTSTTTTPAPNTTTSTTITPAPNTTTSTTTTPAPNTTTSTTTTPKPTPAPTPKPPSPPKQGMWYYTDKKNNITCIVVQFAAQFNVTYNKNVNSSSDFSHVLFNVPINASVTAGNCNGTDQWMQLSWPAVDGSASLNNLTLFYHKNESTKYYALKSLNVSLAREAFPNASAEKIDLWHGVEWQTPLATSYRCAAPTQLNLTADVANVVATLTMSSLQEEAFRTTDGKGFSAARECGGGDVPDAVPIAVGCALGGLVLVVLVAYIVARRRSAASGYVSM